MKFTKRKVKMEESLDPKECFLSQAMLAYDSNQRPSKERYRERNGSIYTLLRGCVNADRTICRECFRSSIGRVSQGQVDEQEMLRTEGRW